MYQSKLLFSLVTLGLLGCDAPKNQQTEISEYSKDFLMPMAKEGPIHYEEDFLSVATDVALNDKPFLPEYREFCVSLDALDSSFYDIVVFPQNY